MPPKFASSSAAQAAMAGGVALLLLISGGVAVERFGDSAGSTAERSEPVAQPRATALGTTQITGDAPPAQGTSVEVGGTLLPGDFPGGSLQA